MTELKKSSEAAAEVAADTAGSSSAAPPAYDEDQPLLEPGNAKPARPTPAGVVHPSPAYNLHPSSPYGGPEDGSLPVVMVDSRSPICMHCPVCRANIMTVVTEAPGMKAYMSSLFLCFLNPIFSLLPLCLSGCKDKVHRCPSCTAVLAIIPA
ncbi:hypothetical protein HDU86_008016 [Geranomyces michiganensis]|nr:hypothetical protein HDU86_008016 [Geranomyces michiganensis]